MELNTGVPDHPIINADDLGLSTEINEAIVIAFRNGWINSSSLMTNMPGFDNACMLVQSENLEGRIGVHLNLSEGRPLTHQIAESERFCDQEGMFRPRSASLRDASLYLAPAERRVVREELEAQVQTFYGRGLKPTHLDSHHHKHTEWAIGSIVLNLARDREIPTIRIMRNCRPPDSMLKRFYRATFNSRLRRSALARSRYFGDVTEIRSILGRSRDVEIMVHPRLSQTVVVDDGYGPLGQIITDLRLNG